MSSPFVVGAVAYDPKVVAIWEGFRDWFRKADFALDYVLFSTYESQVDALLDGVVDVAWNSPLAWVQSRRRASEAGRVALATVMRDTDQDLTSVLLVRADAGFDDCTDLHGCTIAVGALDSPQSRLIPLLCLADAGLSEAEYDEMCLDVSVGKHGDHVAGERDAVRALLDSRADVACIIGANQLLFAQEGTLPPGRTRVLAETEPYDHCVFTAMEDAVDLATLTAFDDLLLSMSLDDPELRVLMQMEGLNEWRPARVTGFEQLERAVDLFRFMDGAGRSTVRHIDA